MEYDVQFWGDDASRLITSVEFELHVLHLPDQELLELIKDLLKEIEKNNDLVEAN